MRLLCVHQNFPGQFRDIAPKLVERGHQIKAISSSNRESHHEIEILRYTKEKVERSGIHHLTTETDDWIRRSEQVARQAIRLRERKWSPDIILAHPGWGETILLRDVFPCSPQILWPELWLRPEHMGITTSHLTLEQCHYLRNKNCLLDAALSEADAAVVPTIYQARCFPDRWKQKIEVIHEGVPEKLFEQTRLEGLCIGSSVTLKKDVPVVTFISRNLEPMRGFPEFVRALTRLQSLNPTVIAVIVGGDAVSYSDAPGDGKTWKQTLLEEVGERLDHSRIHWFGHLPHEELIKLYRRSDLHAYLSAAFVLSWSLTEILACGTPVIAKKNPMAEEFIESGVNGFLYEGSDEELANKMALILRNKAASRNWGAMSRTKLSPLRQDYCITRLERLMQALAIRY